MSDMLPEFREHTPPHDSEDTEYRDHEPVVAQYSGESGVRVRNEVRGHVSGAVIQIAGDHHGGIRL